MSIEEKIEELKTAMEAAEKIADLYADSENLRAAENAVIIAGKARTAYNKAVQACKCISNPA